MTEFERRAFEAMIFMKGYDEFQKRGLTRSQIEDVVRRIADGKQTVMTTRGELDGIPIPSLISDLADDPKNAHLFATAEPQSEVHRSAVPEHVQKMSARERLEYANTQNFADMRRNGKEV